MNLFEKTLLEYLNKQQLQQIQSVHIGIGGAGGIGSNVAIILTRCGFRYFEIIDFDKITVSNLNRQHYFLKDIGKTKVSVLKKYLLNINPDVKIKLHTKKWNVSDGECYFKGCDFIIEAFDIPKNKQQFIEYYQDKTKYLISANGIAGINITPQIQIKKIGNIFFVGDRKTGVSKHQPPMSPGVITCASLMAGIVLNICTFIPKKAKKRT